MKEKIEAIRHDVFLVLTDPECDLSDGAKAALRYVMNELEALAEQPAQKDSPWCMKMNGCKTKCEDCPDEVRNQPAQPEPLTDEQIREASLQAGMQEHYMDFHSGFIRFARAIEAAHGITKGGAA